MKKEIYDIQEKLYKNKIKNKEDGWSNSIHLNFKLNLLNKSNLDKVLNKVLIIGCGDGQVIYELATKNKNTLYTGIDISEIATDWARKRCQDLPNVEIFKSDILEWSTKDKYDLIIDDYILHCIIDDDRNILVNKIKSWLTDAGDFFSFTIVKDNKSINETYQIINNIKIRHFLTPVELNNWFKESGLLIKNSSHQLIEDQPIQFSVLTKDL